MKLVSLRTFADKTNKDNFLHFYLFLVLFFSTIMLGFSQNYTSTGESTDWNDSAAWICQGGPCANNPVPDKNVGNSTITVLHDIVFDSNNPINLGNKAVLEVKNGANLIITSNLNVFSGGTFTVDDGNVSIGPGVLNNDGMISLNRAVLTKNGNFVNETDILITNSCIRLTSGNFINNGSLSGDGNIKVEDGNINNYGSWSASLEYYFSNNSTGLPGSAISEDEIDEQCDCILTNCDIVPGVPNTTKINDLIGSELTSLYNNYVPGENLNPDIFTISSDLVLLKIVVNENRYDAVVSFLSNYGISTSDFYADYYNIEDDQLVITVFFPIASLLDLNDETDDINQVYPASRPVSNIGLIDSQGDEAQRSKMARLGWDLTGENIKVGVISDSYDRKTVIISGNSEAVENDMLSEDLPGPLNPVHTNPVNVLLDFPFGLASDEGRAMLQIVHDVAPKADLYFRTGFISEGNLAAGIADLVAEECDVIIDDLTYLNAPFYRDGIIANAIDDAASLGVHYFTSAGNFGNKSYEAVFTPSSTNPERHDFGGTSLQELTLGVGQYVLALQWDDDFYSLGSPTGSANDMDIYLADATGVVTYGFNRNNHGNDPVEIMHFTVINPTTTNLVIERIGGDGSPLKFKYVVFRAGNDNEFLANPPAIGSTIVGHANAEGAITVGAVSYVNTPAFGGAFAIQQSSSRGGLSIDGQVRSKPDLAAPTGGETTVNLGGFDLEGNGIPNFFGTSASAPHAAGVATLLLQAKQKFGVDVNNEVEELSIRRLLTDYAIDIETAGFDLASGAGFVSATNSVSSFANPTPRIISLNLEDLEDTEYKPGEIEFELIINGEFFIEDAKVILRDIEIIPTFVDENTLSVTIPTFIGNPTLVVNNAPQPETNGLDGGDSNSVTFFDPIIKDVIVRADAATRRYGEPNPDFTFTAEIQDSEDQLTAEELELLSASVVLSTSAGPDTDVGIPAINVEILEDIAPDLLELYNFIPDAGVLSIEPMPVLIQPSEFSAITYGDPFPDIEFDYTFGEPGELDVMVDATVVANFMSNHQSSLSTLNGISFVNGLSFVNGITYVDGEPTINGISLVNKTFFVSDGVVANAPTVSQNGLSFVNGDGSELLIEFGSDLFTTESIDNGSLSELTNGISFVNGFKLASSSAYLDGTLFVNGISLVNGISYVNGSSFVNGISFVNGTPFVNGIPFVNGTPFVNGETTLSNLFDNTFVILSMDDANTVGPIGIKPVNVISSSEAGTQVVIPGGLLDTNFTIRYAPTELIINPAELTVAADDKTITYGEAVPTLSGTATGLKYGDLLGDLFPDGLTFEVDCTECTAVASPHEISITGTASNNNYNITFDNGELTVNKFSLTAAVDDATITYGEAGPLSSSITYSVTDLPFDDTTENIFGEAFTFTPSDGCTSSSTIAIANEQQPDNYDLSYVAGNLTIEKVSLTLSIADSFILQGAATPNNFEITAEGLICNDQVSNITSYIIKDLDNNVVSGILPAGQYLVYLDTSNLTSLANYDISDSPGNLYVNPSAGCNDRIRASDICKISATPAEYPAANTLLRFEYTNSLSVPIYIPHGSKNELKGRALAFNKPPEIFEPGTHTFDIYTNGDNIQWEITTYGCNKPSKSATGSNADICDDLSFSSSYESSAKFQSDLKFYPNPVEDIFHVKFTDEKPLSIKVYNEIGMLLISKDINSTYQNEISLDLSALKSGLHFVEIQTDTRNNLFKIIKK